MRLATYNAENLFTRVKVLDLPNSTQASRMLAKIDDLQQVLKKPKYTRAMQTQLVALQEAVKQYAFVNEETGKLWARKGSKIIGVKAAGYGQGWTGSIAFRPGKPNDTRSRATADAIRAVKAQVMCLVEVEGRQVLDDFSHDLLNGRFAYNLLIDSPNDPRGIDVGLYSQAFGLGSIHSHCFDCYTKQGKTHRVFSRDCLEVQLQLPGGESLFVLCNHLKSKLSSSGGISSDEKRRQQATRVSQILDDYDLTKQYVVVLGDFNDTPGSAALKPLLSHKHLHDVFDLGQTVPVADRWTYEYQKQKQQIDYLLVSSALAAQFAGQAGVERTGMGVASDHAAVWADFKLP